MYTYIHLYSISKLKNEIFPKNLDVYGVSEKKSIDTGTFIEKEN